MIPRRRLFVYALAGVELDRDDTEIAREGGTGRCRNERLSGRGMTGRHPPLRTHRYYFRFALTETRISPTRRETHRVGQA